ncbi:MAG TPA: hypothetical protein VFL91_11825, partial [Thermomicrobiales bacterium]|nr:hypothetical protein [Thermomicrobiales bacterium]
RQPRGNNDAASVRYIFYVQPEGHFGVYLVRPDGSEQTLQAPTPSAAIKVGSATNHLAVACQGDKITVSINGQAVGTYTATVLNAGEIGLYASSPTNTGNLEAVFTNLRLTSK